MSEQIAVENARIGYEVATTLLITENETLWSKFHALLLANSILLTLIIISITSQNPSTILRAVTFVMDLAGILLCYFWFLLTSRSSDYRNYWMLSARELEEQYLNNPVKTISRGRRFTNGKVAKFNLEDVKSITMNPLGHLVPVTITINFIIGLFLELYFALFFLGIISIIRYRGIIDVLIFIVNNLY